MRGLFTSLVLLILIPLPAVAQLPRVGSIDFYGLRKLAPADLAGAIGVQIGDSLTVSREQASATIRERLLQVPGVADADVSVVCCEAGRALMYVGIREKNAAALALDTVPNGSVRLPAEMIAAEREFLRYVMEAVRSGQAEEDESAGHSLLKYPPAGAVQQRFIAYATQRESLLRDVLRHSSDAHHRAVAAQLIAYVPDKRTVIPDLVHAVRDADADVRNNATRSLAVMATFAQSNPDAGLHVPVEPFIDLLNSVEWTDRNKASFVLTALTTDRDPALLQKLRERAVDALVEMARWHAIGHAAPAGIILGRIAGLPEDQIFPTFIRNREDIIAAALAQR